MNKSFYYLKIIYLLITCKVQANVSNARVKASQQGPSEKENKESKTFNSYVQSDYESDVEADYKIAKTDKSIRKNK